MTCSEARRHWNLYHDSEGDPEMHFLIGEHLAVCPECAEWFSQESRLEHLIAEKLARSSPAPEIWTQVLANCALARRVSSRRWMMLAGLASCAAAVVLIWFEAVSLTRKKADLTDLAASIHERLVAGKEEIPFRSQSDQQVESYLRQRVSFPVRCPPRKNAGFSVQGTGVCSISHQPAAYLVGHVGVASVSIFILPSRSLEAFPQTRDHILQERAHHCRRGPYEMVASVIDRNVVLVIGQLKPELLLKVLNAYGSYHETPLESSPGSHPA